MYIEMYTLYQYQSSLSLRIYLQNVSYDEQAGSSDH